MANTKKYVSLDKLGLYDEKIKEVISAGDAASLKSAKDYADSLASNYEAAGNAATEAGKVQTKLDEEVARATKEEERIAGLVATAQGIVIPANIYGKLKTISQMVFSLVIMILAELNDIGVLGESFPISAVSNGLLWITAALCVVSGVIYVKQSIKLIDFSK